MQGLEARQCRAHRAHQHELPQALNLINGERAERIEPASAQTLGCM